MANVTLRNVRKTYAGGFEAIKGIDFGVGDGQFCVLVGPSGCGKSTLLRMVAGLETITGGEIDIGGRVVNQVEPADRDIAMVFQNYALYPHMTVYNNMAYGLRNRGMAEPEIKTRVEEAARILELGAMLERKPRQLSGGQRQRVAMGRAIVRQPKVFLFDEPLSNLDAKLRIAMRVEIRKLQRRLSTTSIYVTHDQLEAMTLADILVVMNGGQVEQIGNPLDIYQKPATTFDRLLHRRPADESDAAALRRDSNRNWPAISGSTRPASSASALRISSSRTKRFPAAWRSASPWKRSSASAPKLLFTAPDSRKFRASPPPPANCRRARSSCGFPAPSARPSASRSGRWPPATSCIYLPPTAASGWVPESRSGKRTSRIGAERARRGRFTQLSEALEPTPNHPHIPW